MKEEGRRIKKNKSVRKFPLALLSKEENKREWDAQEGGRTVRERKERYLEREPLKG